MTHSTRTFLAHPRSLASVVSVFAVLLAGCGLQSGSTTASSTMPTIAGGGHGSISGKVHGGQNPVTGSVIQLYAVGSSGYTSAATPLIASSAQVVYNPAAAAGTTGALTDGSGSFTITGDYSCPTGSYVYITASGGNSGSGSNPNIAMMAALGPCSQLSSSTGITIDEVTTVAGAYALAQFSGGSTFGTALSSQAGSGSSAPSDNFATSSSNLQGVANAMATASVLANISTGTSPGGNSNGTATPDYWQINMIADILAACINTASPFANCTTLYSNVNPVGGKAPADTLQAAVAMALSPSLSNCATGATCGSTQIGALFALIPASGVPFQPYPVTATQINDMTIGITYNPVVPGGAASTVGSLTLSANPGGAGCTAPTIAFSGGGGSGATAVAALGTGATAAEIVAVQVTNPGSGYTSTPTATISGCTTAPTLSVSMLAPTLLNNYADSINIDAYGDVWVGTQTHPIVAGTLPAAFVELDPTGNPIPNVASPAAVASSYQITSYKVGGTATTILGQYSGVNLYGNFNGAFDTNNNFWFVDSSTGNTYATGITRGNLVGFPGSGAAYTTSGYTSGLHNGAGAGAYGYSMNNRRPSALAIDGSNNIWLQIVGGSATTNNIDQSTTVSSLSGITNNGLYGVLGVTTPSATAVAAGSPGTSVIFGGSNAEMAYQVLVDPNTGDKAGGAAIPGAPFAWALSEGGLNPTGNNTDGSGKGSNLIAAAQGALFPYYTTASGLDYLGATINQGSYTPLSHNLDPDGILTSNGISSSAGGFVPTITFPATGCATTPTASPVISSTGTISSVTLVSNGGSGCTTATGTAVTLTSTANDLPTTAATVTYTASGGVVTGLTVTAAGAGYGIETTPIGGTAGGTLTAKGGTTGTGVTSNVAFSSSDYFDFPMSNVWNGVFDSAGNLWMSNGKSANSTSALGNPALTVGTIGTTGSMTKLNLSYGTAFTPAQFESSTTYNLYHSIAGMNAVGLDANNPTATAIDGGNNVYFNIYTPGGGAKDTAGSAVGALSSSGTALSPTTPASGFLAAGFSGSCYWQSTVINGVGTSCITGPVSANQASPYHRNFTRAYYGIAVDGSGNIWYTTAIDNTQALTSTGANVVEIVGAAVPVVTPTSLGLKNGTYGTKP